MIEKEYNNVESRRQIRNQDKHEFTQKQSTRNQSLTIVQNRVAINLSILEQLDELKQKVVTFTFYGQDSRPISFDYEQGLSDRQAQQPSILPVSFQSKAPFPPASEQSLLSVTELQRLKLRVVYLEEQLAISREQNQQIMRQKKTINENYIQLINKQIQTEDQKHQQLAQMKLGHAQELNQYSHQLSAYSQAISRLQVETLKREEQMEIQVRLFRDRQTGLLDTVSMLQRQVIGLKSESQNYLMKINHYEHLMSKKQAHILQLHNESTMHAKNLNLHKAEYESLMKMFTSLQNQNHALQSQNQSLHHTITQLHNQLTLNESAINKLNQEISVLLKIDNQSHQEIALQKQTLNTLQQQHHSLNLSYSELLTTSEQSLNTYRQNQQSFLNEINALKQLHSKLRQQNATLIKHVQNLKDRETLLIESEKNAREKLTTQTEKKNKQIQDLCVQNERLYKQINKIKFNTHSVHPVTPSPLLNQTQSSFVHNFNPSK